MRRQGFTPAPSYRKRRELRVERGRSSVCPYHGSREKVWGFTIIEIMVAVSMFLILASFAIGGFVRIMRIQRQVSAIVASDSNVNLAIEQMAREMRTGSHFCTQENYWSDCPIDASPASNLTSICFLNGLRQTVVYGYDAMEKRITRGVSDSGSFITPGEQCDVAAEGAQPITGSNARVEYLLFRLFGHWSSSEDNIPGNATPSEVDAITPDYPPKITIAVGVTPNTNDPQIGSSVLNLQTTVSARLTE